MSPALANTIYDILVEHAQASERNRDDFVYCMGEALDRHEYRFQGSLGFGGKFYLNARGPRVSCYREDETEERCRAVITTNAALAAVWPQ